MPELPEVETVRSGLEMILAKRPTIKRVRLARKDIRFLIPKDFVVSLEGQTITGVRRRAKYLLIETAKVSLLSHLGMTGSWRIEAKDNLEASIGPHDHCFIELSDTRTLVYRDPRRFGVLDLLLPGEETTHLRLKALGPEPFDELTFNPDYLFALSRMRKVAIKVFLMDQRVVVGVGNIYASEVLFRARIRPQKLAGKITKHEAARIVDSVRSILREAIKAGGSSIRDYKNAEGESGSFQQTHQVYERAKEPCRVCGRAIRSKVLGGRSTYWCPHCQKV
jgi:formamidopyrimidine-DNA glycosylase